MGFEKLMHVPTSLVMMDLTLFYQASGKNTCTVILSDRTFPELKSELLMLYSYFKFHFKENYLYEAKCVLSQFNISCLPVLLRRLVGLHPDEFFSLYETSRSLCLVNKFRSQIQPKRLNPPLLFFPEMA